MNGVVARKRTNAGFRAADRKALRRSRAELINERSRALSSLEEKIAGVQIYHSTDVDSLIREARRNRAVLRAARDG